MATSDSGMGLLLAGASVDIFGSAVREPPSGGSRTRQSLKPPLAGRVAIRICAVR